MNDKYQLTENEIAALIKASKELKPGEMVEGAMDRKTIKGTGTIQVIAYFKPEDKPFTQAEQEFMDKAYNKPKVISGPFTISSEGEKLGVGYINSIVQKENAKGFSLIKDFVKKIKDSYLSFEESILGNKLENDELEELDKESARFGIDEFGKYELDDFGNKAYIDSRNFNYFVEFDSNGKPFFWIYLDDGTRARFLDIERTKILIGNNLHIMDSTGQISIDGMPFIGNVNEDNFKTRI